ATAVKLQFGHVLSGLAAGSGKPERERLIDDFAVSRIAHARQSRLTRLRHAADQSLKRGRCMRAAEAHHCDCCRRTPGGKGEDGVVRAHAACFKTISTAA